MYQRFRIYDLILKLGLWDLWARLEGKPVWKLLTDMNPAEIMSLLDFGWITDELTKEEALTILTELESTKNTRLNDLERSGFPGSLFAFNPHFKM